MLLLRVAYIQQLARGFDHGEIEHVSVVDSPSSLLVRRDVVELPNYTRWELCDYLLNMDSSRLVWGGNSRIVCLHKQKKKNFEV